MAQEVQTTLDYKAELNEIEWIWYQQRRVSDKMQVRDKVSSQVTALADTTSLNYPDVWAEAIVPWWTLTSKWGIEYQSESESLIVPLAWAYMIQYISDTTYPQATYFYELDIKVDGITQYSERIALGDHETKTISLNLGKKNKITVSMTPEFTVIANVRPTIRLIRL